MVKKPFFWLCKAVLIPFVGIGYFIYRIIKKRTAAFSAVMRERALGFLANRYAIHAVVIVLAFVVTATNLYASDGRNQQPDTVAPTSILGSLTQNQDQVVVVEDVGNQNVNGAGEVSYLAGQALTAQDGADGSGDANTSSQDQQGVDSGAYQDDPNELLLSSSSPLANSVRVQPQMGDGSAPQTRTKVEDYVVADGDSVGTIADKFGLRIDTLLASNGLSSRGMIHPGDKLRIPPVDGVIYTVKKGDTISRIADKYSSDVGKIMDTNGLASVSSISPGDELILPDGKLPTPPTPKPPSRLATNLKNVFAPDDGTHAPSPQEVANGRMVWPSAARRISQYYGVWEYFGARHTGVDIAGPMGTPIYAAKGGTVLSSGWNSGGYGNMIIIDHGGGLFTRYGHTSKLLVRAGEEVKKGQVIALEGSTGRSTGPHLHFEVMTHDPLHRVNPLEYIR